MKLDIFIVEILLVAVVALPYLTFAFLGLKGGRELGSRFLQEMKKRNFKAGHKGKWNNNRIALDMERSSFLLVQQYNRLFECTQIHLQKVITVVVVTAQKNVDVGGKLTEQLERVVLEFQYLAGEVRLVTLYESDRTYQQDFEIENAEKWCLLMNEHLRSKPFFDAAA